MKNRTSADGEALPTIFDVIRYNSQRQLWAAGMLADEPMDPMKQWRASQAQQAQTAPANEVATKPRRKVLRVRQGRVHP